MKKLLLVLGMLAILGGCAGPPDPLPSEQLPSHGDTVQTWFTQAIADVECENVGWNTRYCAGLQDDVRDKQADAQRFLDRKQRTFEASVRKRMHAQEMATFVRSTNGHCLYKYEEELYYKKSSGCANTVHVSQLVKNEAGSETYTQGAHVSGSQPYDTATMDGIGHDTVVLAIHPFTVKLNGVRRAVNSKGRAKRLELIVNGPPREVSFDDNDEPEFDVRAYHSGRNMHIEFCSVTVPRICKSASFRKGQLLSGGAERDIFIPTAWGQSVESVPFSITRPLRSENEIAQQVSRDPFQEQLARVDRERAAER